MALELDDSFLYGGEEDTTVITPTETLDDSFLFQDEEVAVAPELTEDIPLPTQKQSGKQHDPEQIRPVDQAGPDRVCCHRGALACRDFDH